MTAPSFALILGLFYTGFGLLGTLPSLSMLAADPQVGYAYLFGLFRVNGVLDALHFLLGFWGLVAWSGALRAVAYARSASVLLAATALAGLVPAPWHALPLQGHNVWLHALTALAAGYVGFRSLARRPALLRRERRRGLAERRRASRPIVQERRGARPDRRQGYGGSTLPAG